MVYTKHSCTHVKWFKNYYSGCDHMLPTMARASHPN